MKKIHLKKSYSLRAKTIVLPIFAVIILIQTGFNLLFIRQIQALTGENAGLTAELSDYDKEKASRGSKYEYFTDQIEASGNISSGDLVEIRICYSNAEDYRVIAAKCLSFAGNDGMTFEMSEEEILVFSSALFDKRNYSGTRLYAVKCPETETGRLDNCEYIPVKNILEIIDNTELQEKRTLLEERLNNE
ncbi:MAG: hypothetical protein K6B75_00830 [Lachnospiraceae bacterium]|nr:hypothetical protein [Lachnospiraceae bacterium]